MGMASPESEMDDPVRKVFDHLRAISARAFELIHVLDERRKLIDRYFRVHPSTSEIHGRWHPVGTGHVPMEWVVADRARPDRRILYIHGGSWISGSPAGYRAFVSRISEAAGAAVLSVDYRLAPEHVFPAGLNDCVMAYQWMRENGPDGPEPAGLYSRPFGEFKAFCSIWTARSILAETSFRAPWSS